MRLLYLDDKLLQEYGIAEGQRLIMSVKKDHVTAGESEAASVRTPQQQQLSQGAASTPASSAASETQQR